MNILKLRQTSACECTYRLCHIRMRQSSRNRIFINTRKPKQRYRMLKFYQFGHATGYHDNIFVRYENCPLQHTDYNFTDISLLEFAMLFEPYYTKNKDSDDTNEDLDEDALVDDPCPEVPLILLSHIKGIRTVHISPKLHPTFLVSVILLVFFIVL